MRYFKPIYILLFLCMAGFTHHVQAQAVFLEEDFENWVNNCPAGWSCPTPATCSNTFCAWGQNDSFPAVGTPITAGCDGGFYARCHTVGLPAGVSPVLTSPIIDLGTYTDTFPILLSFCYINPTQTGSDDDGIQLEFSTDSGASWQIFTFIQAPESQWTQQNVEIPPAWHQSGFRVRFRGVSNVSTGDIGLDGISIFEAIPPCKAGPSQIQSMGNLNVCKDGQADTLGLQANYAAKANYQYILTDLQDRVILPIPDGLFNPDDVPTGSYKIYGISYSGALVIQAGMPIQHVSATVCHWLSDNHISFQVYQISASVQATSFYNGYEVSGAGKKDGAIRVIPQGGQAPYSYTWTSHTLPNIPNPQSLEAGIYTVRVSDVTGCSYETQVVLNAPEPIVLSFEKDLGIGGFDLTCANDKDGQVKAKVSGGVPPYQYKWSTGSTQAVVSQLGVGAYTLTVTDNNQNTHTQPITVTAPQPLQAEVNASIPSCGIDSVGDISLTVVGGVAPYAFQWNDGNRQNARQALPSGDYTCIITDAYGCEALATSNLDIATPLSLTKEISTPTCGEDSTAMVMVIPEGGTAPYTLTWSHGPEGEILPAVEPGDYEVMIMDAEGCMYTEQVEVEVAAPLKLSLFPTNDNGNQNGSIRVQIEGGTGPYNFNWGHGPQVASLENLEAGTYTLTVRDDNGCETNQKVEVVFEDVVPSLCTQIHIGFSPNGDGVNDYWYVPCLDTYTKNQVAVYNRWGQEVFQAENYNQLWDGTIEGQGLPDGTYFYIIRIPIENYERVLEGTVNIIR
ncbi:MAG: gliding motility-associated C-terminal domain-containing protein [Bacteroidota bacterium]